MFVLAVLEGAVHIGFLDCLPEVGAKGQAAAVLSKHLRPVVAAKAIGA
ncbi:hypothetical protein Z950_1147 [Sulfitobacter mediterraneus KCTC 32188]|nr:hypothetical protein Z950_1147 [Sulfitobacter mediterraneus KCTC 32188]